ncbi:MAG: antibiotic biosynthesis monooxygenase [Nitrosarchaeum sp.]|jgi:heme-degrading monooxygenase HmoA|uniref:antibiotic biosynthesis monooxygenase family protein n=1 Tax=Nitrosarchaeum sp. TaxID=2026886 RepID=UPI002DF27CE9|nr:antibiotic biosynthesis monooxygenase [Nitrosarchaeum sp.]
MFVVISDVQIKPESLDGFKNWFSESNKTVSKFDGFINRRLLETKNGKHRILVEFENLEKFSKMHQSPEHENLHSIAASYMEKLPEPKFYTVVSQ